MRARAHCSEARADAGGLGCCRLAAVRTSLVALFLVVGSWISAGSQATELVALRTALERLQERGLRIVFSDALVRPEMMALEAPPGLRPQKELDSLLSPHGLEARTLAGGTIVVVAAGSSRRSQRSLAGTVRSGHSGEVLVGARVEVVRDGQVLSETSTLANGFYEFPPLEAGRFVLRASAPGYVTRQSDSRQLQDAVSSRLDLELQPLPLVEDRIMVRASDLTLLREAAAAPTALDREEIEALPHLGGDPFRALSLAPGAASNDRSARLNIRGGRSDELQVVLDGQEVYEPFHLQDFDGALGVVPVESLSGASLSTGSFAVGFGDRMGGVLDLSSRESSGEGKQGTLGLSLLSAGVSHAGRLPGDAGGWLVSARRGSIDLAGRLLGRENPAFWDAFGRLDLDLSGSQQLRGHVLRASDSLAFSEFVDGESKVFDTSYQGGYQWLTHQAVVGTRALVQTTASWSRLERDRRGVEDEEEQTFAVADRRDVEVSRLSHVWDLSLAGSQELSWGVEALRYDVDYSYEASVDRELRLVSLGLPSGVSLQDPNRAEAFQAAVRGEHGSGWLSYRTRAHSRLNFEIGARYDRHTLTDDTLFSPRLNVAWKLGEKSVVRLAAGRFHQSQRPYELQVADGETRFARAEGADHFTLGFERVFDRGALKVVRAEAYVREIDDPRPRHESLFEPYNTFPEVEIDRVRIVADRNRNEGLELLLRGTLGKRTEWRATATVSEARDHHGVQRIDRQIHQPLALNLLTSTSLPGRWTLSLAWRLHSGWRTTPFGLVSLGTETESDLDEPGEEDGDAEELFAIGVGALNSRKLEDYHRLDLRLSRSFDLGESGFLRGRLLFFLDLQNAYGQRNRAGFDLSIDDGQLVVERERWPGIVPSAGIRWEF